MQFLRSALAGLTLVGLSVVASAASAGQACELGKCAAKATVQERLELAVNPKCKAIYDRYQRCLKQQCSHLKKNSREHERCAGQCQSPWEDCENRNG